MHKTENRLTDLEIQLTHQSRLVEELSEIIARQDAELRKLTKIVKALTEKTADFDEALRNTPNASEKPPHW